MHVYTCIYVCVCTCVYVLLVFIGLRIQRFNRLSTYEYSIADSRANAQLLHVIRIISICDLKFFDSSQLLYLRGL